MVETENYGLKKPETGDYVSDTITQLGDNFDTIDTELKERETEGETLQTNIDAEASTREDADTTLQTNINAHIADKDNPHAVTAAQAGVEASETNGNIVLDGEETTVYTHPTYSTTSGTTTSAPTFGGTFTALSSITTSNGHTTAKTTKTVTIPNTEATDETAGLMSADDKATLDDISENGVKNPNALTLTMNGTAATYDGSATASKTWYAPTTYGTSGYELTANGSGSAPLWKQPTGAIYCTTAASTAAKVSGGNATNFKLATGARVSVRFQYANTATTPTLNINSTGAKTIGRYTGYSTVATELSSIGTWSAGEIVDFVYNGTYWIAVSSSMGWLHTTEDTAEDIALSVLYNFNSNNYLGIDEVTTAGSTSKK